MALLPRPISVAKQAEDAYFNRLHEIQKQMRVLYSAERRTELKCSYSRCNCDINHFRKQH